MMAFSSPASTNSTRLNFHPATTCLVTFSTWTSSSCGEGSPSSAWVASLICASQTLLPGQFSVLWPPSREQRAGHWMVSCYCALAHLWVMPTGHGCCLFIPQFSLRNLRMNVIVTSDGPNHALITHVSVPVADHKSASVLPAFHKGLHKVMQKKHTNYTRGTYSPS